MTAIAAQLLGRSRRAEDPKAIAHVDLWLHTVAVVLTGLGLAMIYSTTRAKLGDVGRSEFYFVQRQGLALVLGLVVMLLAMLVDYRRLREFFALVWVATMPLLLAVLALGNSSRGAQSWFQLGPLQFQPSEIAKLLLIVSVAGYCSQHRGDLDAWHLAVALALIGFPAGLVLLQNDLGTAMVMVISGGAILFVSGLRKAHLAVLVLLAVTAVGAAAFTGYFDDYKLDRLTSFVKQGDAPSATASPAQYNLQWAKNAIVSGQVTGQGFMNGRLTTLSYVPEQHTDFIFTVVAEELGFVGGAVLLGLFGVLLVRMYRISLLSADYFGSLVSIGVLAWFAFQIFENIGMTMGIMPITGLPLPFLSYGGSALIAEFAAIGLLGNIHMRRFS